MIVPQVGLRVVYCGGVVAAPAFQKIVGWAVPYLGISPR